MELSKQKRIEFDYEIEKYDRFSILSKLFVAKSESWIILKKRNKLKGVSISLDYFFEFYDAFFQNFPGDKVESNVKEITHLYNNTYLLFTSFEFNKVIYGSVTTFVNRDKLSLDEIKEDFKKYCNYGNKLTIVSKDIKRFKENLKKFKEELEDKAII